MPIEPDKPVDLGIKRFCDKCKICAEECPSKAISFYSTIFQPIFWMIMGLLIGVFALSLKYWLQDFKIVMNRWKWILLSAWLLLLAITLGGGFTLMGENEWIAGIRFLLFFGIIVVITGAGLFLLLRKSRE